MNPQELPVVQFREFADFIDDLAAGRVSAVWYDLEEPAGFGWYKMHTIVRALVTDGDGLTRIAAFAFLHDERLIIDGREADLAETRAHRIRLHGELMTTIKKRLGFVGVTDVRVGELSIPYNIRLVYGRHPRPEREP